MNNKRTILIICNYYLPGYKAGGGLRTIVNMVERFKDEFDFRLISFNHDGDGIPYNTVETDRWNEVGGAQVYYLSKQQVKLMKLRELISQISPELIYINSVFSVLSIYTLILRKLWLIAEVPVVIAPEGELSEGALQLKAGKKKTFAQFAKATGLYKKLIWKVTAEPEKVETERFTGSNDKIFIAPNMPSETIFESYRQELKPKKNPGEAKMIFLSRYARKKNFKWLIDNLNGVEGSLTIDVYGPLEDEVYWKETQLSIVKLPPNIKVNYKGQATYEEVIEIIFKYQFFLLPTLGENFGHVFIEALAAGCPLLISDRTPWTNLQAQQIGWDLPLEEPHKWVEVINRCINLDNEMYKEISSNSREFAVKWLTDPKIAQDTLKVLHYALKSG